MITPPRIPRHVKAMHEIQVIDSHTAGEPTRVIVAGGPDLGFGPLDQQRQRFDQQFDRFRTAVIGEPRGSDVLVGALLCPPHQSDCLTGVIFFNNIGYLGMCGHGMIGVVETLAHLGRITAGEHRIDTPVGIVTIQLHPDRSVSVQNVASYRKATGVQVDVPTIGLVRGDVAWGGNWFFLTDEPKYDLDKTSVADLQQAAIAIRKAVHLAGFPEVDHVELFGKPISGAADSRNFVLCPGLEYDRSPCGTGTSAKLACLAADGKLAAGEPWTQEGILGTSFQGHYQWDNESEGRILPTIQGRAFVTSSVHLHMDPDDPFAWGIGCSMLKH